MYQVDTVVCLRHNYAHVLCQALFLENIVGSVYISVTLLLQQDSFWIKQFLSNLIPKFQQNIRLKEYLDVFSSHFVIDRFFAKKLNRSTAITCVTK